MQDSDAEATVLEALAAHDAGVEEDHAICKAEEETWTNEDISEDDETSEEEEMSGTEDKKPKGCEGAGEGEGDGGGAGGGAKDEVCLTVLLSESAIITSQQVLPSQEICRPNIFYRTILSTTIGYLVTAVERPW
jgi:hypothetical protein